MPGVDPVAIHHVRYPLQKSGGSVFPGKQWVDVEEPFQPGTCWGAGSNDYPCHYVEFRFVKLTPTITKSKIFPGGFRVRRCEIPPQDYFAEFEYLIDLGILEEPWIMSQVDGLTGDQQPMAKEMVGIFVPMSSQPPFEAGATQIPGSIGQSEHGTNVFEDP